MKLNANKLSKKIMIIGIICLPMIVYANVKDGGLTAKDKKGVISNCIRLLPKTNKMYSINLDVNIDASKLSPKPEGKMSITDNTKSPLSDKDQMDIKEFKECIVEGII